MTVVVIVAAVAWVASLGALTCAALVGFGAARGDPDTEQYAIGAAVAGAVATGAWASAIVLAGA